MTYAIHAEGLRKSFGDVVALDGVDLVVPAGTVLAVLGPNGAGETPAVRILAPLLRPDAGRAGVAGHDVLAEPTAVRRTIGLTGQYASVDEQLTGRRTSSCSAAYSTWAGPPRRPVRPNCSPSSASPTPPIA